MNSKDNDLLEILTKKEKSLIDPIARKQPESLHSLLSPSFFEFGCSGKVWQRSETLQLLGNVSPEVEATDFKLHPLASDVMLLTYKTIRRDENGNSYSVLRSSIWKKNENEWQMMFHQGTKSL